MNENDKLPLIDEGEEREMAQIPCAWCGWNFRNIGQTEKYSTGSPANDVLPKDILRCVLTCGKCGGKTVFQLEDGYALTFLPGKLLTEGLRNIVAPNAKEMHEEALLCFYGGSGRGTVAFCRSAVEEALAHKNVPGRDLDAKIKNAPKDILGDEEKALANGARLTGRNAIHRMAEVSDSQGMLALTTTADLLNHIAQQRSLPASQSEKGNNGT